MLPLVAKKVTWNRPPVKPLPPRDNRALVRRINILASSARLQTRFPNVDFEVIVISLDREGFAATQPFLEEIGVDNLPSYLDQRSALALSIGALGLPTTILLGEDGVWLGRMVGPIEWDSDEAVNFVAKAIEGVSP